MLSLAVTSLQASERHLFDEGWMFFLGNKAEMSQADYNDSQWRKLNLPHDWAIEGDFSASALSGAGGGALPGGIGWYRKHFYLDSNKKQDKLFIDFDGVYMNSTIWVNGHELGTRPYGFSSFSYDISPYIYYGKDNVIAVKVDNSDQPNCRWYSGCGIYRHVYLRASSNVHIARWGTEILHDVNASFKKDCIQVNIKLQNENNNSVKAIVLNKLLDADNNVVGKSSASVIIQHTSTSDIINNQKINLKHPHLWTINNPYTYTLRTEVIVDGKVIDVNETPTGIRTIKFDAENGFFLNGQSVKINGVCNHSDLGCLGTAINEDAIHRQLRLLKDMGCNAIRCSHNPPSPELLNMCDTMGFMVMDEAFDMWRRRKTKNDYARFFDKWAERDLSDMVLRDRNHPSIIMWSIGNEVLEQWSSADADTLSLEQANVILNFGHDKSQLFDEKEMNVNSLLTKHLAEIVHKYDKSRPITAGCNEPNPDNHLFKSGALDVIGFNYHNSDIKNFPENFPGKPFIITESVSALQTRGYYRMPSDSITTAPIRWDLPYTDPSFMCSSYDNSHVSWGSTHEETLDLVKHNPFISGQFIWTGWDYIGEPTPYQYPARSSYFGIIDLAGFPKDIYYMYQSEWTDKQVLHLFPHWNWIDGQAIDMWCYYNNADEVELFVNGKSQGTRAKKDSHQYHVMWRVVYHPGEVKAVARKDGKVVAEQTIKTAGAPFGIRLTPDKRTLQSDGKSMSFVTVEVIDKEGNLCPNADNQIFFDIDGAATIAGVDNGCQTSLERFKADNRKAFFGKCLVALQSTAQSGEIHITAKGADLKEGELTLHSRMYE